MLRQNIQLIRLIQWKQLSGQIIFNVFKKLRNKSVRDIVLYWVNVHPKYCSRLSIGNISRTASWPSKLCSYEKQNFNWYSFSESENETKYLDEKKGMYQQKQEILAPVFIFQQYWQKSLQYSVAGVLDVLMHLSHAAQYMQHFVFCHVFY